MIARACRSRRRCDRIARRLPIPVPFDPAAFVTAVGAGRGRPIHLVPATSRAGMPTGMLVSTDTADYIFHAKDTTTLHQWHIVAHEVGHLLRGHAHTSALEDAVARILMPDLPIDLVRRVLGRTVYDDAEEREAELIAYAILRRALRADASASATQGELARLESVFHVPPDQRR